MNQVWRDHGKYSVTKLCNQTKHLKIRRIYLDKIDHNLNKEIQ